jgi:hypothetical protein
LGIHKTLLNAKILAFGTVIVQQYIDIQIIKRPRFFRIFSVRSKKGVAYLCVCELLSAKAKSMMMRRWHLLFAQPPMWLSAVSSLEHLALITPALGVGEPHAPVRVDASYWNGFGVLCGIGMEICL